jgi:hypothetical protein
MKIKTIIDTIRTTKVMLLIFKEGFISNFFNKNKENKK